MRRVVVTGLGLITPLGNDVTSTWESLIAGAALRQGQIGRIAASAWPTRSGSSQPTQRIRGSLRNHASWRRAKRRVPVTVDSFASVSVSSPARKARTWW